MRACTNGNYHPPYDPPLSLATLAIPLLFIPSVIYLMEVHHLLPLDRAYHREQAQKRGLTTEQFRSEELKEIRRCWVPYTRFFARRHLEKECEKLTLWQRRDEKIRGYRA